MRAHLIQPGEPEAGLPVKVVAIQDPAEHRKKLHELIERCAYELYEAHGSEDGHAVEDWRNAELKVLCSDAQCPLGYIEQEDEVDVDAAVEKFAVEELEVSVDPGCVTISGCPKGIRSGEGQVRLGNEPHPIFGALDLPVKIDLSRARATLHAGMLHIVLPKAHEAEGPSPATDSNLAVQKTDGRAA